jgi:hypothetical protein
MKANGNIYGLVLFANMYSILCDCSCFFRGNYTKVVLEMQATKLRLFYSTMNNTTDQSELKITLKHSGDYMADIKTRQRVNVNHVINIIEEATLEKSAKLDILAGNAGR